MSDLFNNREIATGIWLGIAALFAGRSEAVRSSVIDLAKVFANLKIVVPILLMAGYVGLEVVLLKRFGVWNISLLKDTVYWLVLSGFALLMNIIGEKETGKFLKSSVLQCVGITALLEFLLNVRTFPLLGELVLLPVLCYLAAASAFAEYNPQYASVGKVFAAIQSLLGVFLFVYVVRSLYLNHADLATRDTLNSLLLPLLLTLLYLPFLYLWKLVTDYEMFFVRLRIFIPNDHRLRSYVRNKTFKYCHVNLFALSRFQKIVLASNWELKDQQGVSRLIERFKTGQNNDT